MKPHPHPFFTFWDSSDKNFAKKFEELRQQRKHLKSSLSNGAGGIAEQVAAVLKQVRDRGDDALLELTKRYDKRDAQSIRQLTFGPEQFAAAYRAISPALRDAMHSMKDRIIAYHRSQIQYSWRQESKVGAKRDSVVVCGQKIVPLERVGIYVPGGTAVYPSSLLMCALPAQIAEVEDITIVSPVNEDAVALLAAAHIAKANRLHTIGGAQAIAALAYGTESVRATDKIVGPGNAYVTEAKRQLFGVVGIDMTAGPSEVAIVADENAPPEWVAADLCAQAEHDPDAGVSLFSPSEPLLLATVRELGKLTGITGMADARDAADTTDATDVLPRWEIIKEALRRRGLLVKTRSVAEAARLADSLAPEHLQLMVADPEPLEEEIHRTAAVFMGNACPTTFGDYGAGPNHTLPTSPAAAFMSPLGVYDFVKRVGILGVRGNADPEWVRTTEELAAAEGLTAHALSAKLRRTDEDTSQ